MKRDFENTHRVINNAPKGANVLQFPGDVEGNFTISNGEITWDSDESDDLKDYLTDDEEPTSDLYEDSDTPEDFSDDEDPQEGEELRRRLEEYLSNKPTTRPMGRSAARLAGVRTTRSGQRGNYSYEDDDGFHNVATGGSPIIQGRSFKRRITTSEPTDDEPWRMREDE